MRTPTLAGLAAFSVPSLAAIAQTPPDSVQRLPAVEVTSSILPAAGGATRAGGTARASVVDGERLQRLAPRTVADALTIQAGVTTYDDLGSAFKPSLVMRGFTASGVVGLPQGITVFVDGVPVNEPDAGQVNFDLLPRRHVQDVEVLAGTASLLGPHSLGGAVNLVTLRGGGPARGTLSVGAGSHRQRDAAATAAGELGGAAYYVGADVLHEGGWRQLTGASLGQLFLNVGRNGASHGIRVQLNAGRSRAETAGSLPQSIYVARPDSNLSAGDFEDLRQLHATVSGYLPAFDGRASITAFLRAHEAERFNVNQIDDPDVRGLSSNRSLGAQVDWSRTVAVGAALATLRTGMAASVSDVGIRLFAERIDPGLTTDVRSPIRKADLYLLGDLERGPFALTVGARYDVVRVPFRNLLRPARDTTNLFTQVSPRVGLRAAVGAGVSLFASAARGFRAPAVIELACADPQEPCPLPFALGDDPPLAPVVATSVEAGARWTGRAAWADATVYRTNLRDDIFLFPYEDATEPAGSTIDGYFANIPRTRREGVELGAGGAVGARLGWHASYGYTRATFRSTAAIFSIREAEGAENVVSPGDRLPLVPAHVVAAGGALRIGGAVTTGVELRHVGARWLRGDEANETTPLPAHTTTDFHLDAERGAWAVRAALANAFGVRYASFGGFNINQGGGGVLERFLTPGSRRAARLTLTRTFGG